MNSTATGAENKNATNTITFISREHEAFYMEYLLKCRYQDVYHKALIYCLGINRDTREHIDEIYDFVTGCGKVKCLQVGWQTCGSLRVVRLAFSLYCDGMPSVRSKRNTEEKVKECQEYTVSELFCCEYAPYFWEAIKIRYPGYCMD